MLGRGRYVPIAPASERKNGKQQRSEHVNCKSAVKAIVVDGIEKGQTVRVWGLAHPLMSSQNEVAPPFPRSWREGGLSPRALHQFVLGLRAVHCDSTQAVIFNSPAIVFPKSCSVLT